MTDHISTHADGCWEWGPKHYKCAAGKIEALLEVLTALNAENERLRNLLRRVHPIVQAHARASHLFEGFRPKRNQWDDLVDAIDAAKQQGERND